LELNKEETKVVIEKLENLIKLLEDKIDGFAIVFNGYKSC
jgi:hypothetical protein